MKFYIDVKWVDGRPSEEYLVENWELENNAIILHHPPTVGQGDNKGDVTIIPLVNVRSFSTRDEI